MVERYAYGFYLEEGPAKTFFEYLQANAEGITERLTEALMLPADKINAEDLKNRIRVTKKVPLFPSILILPYCPLFLVITQFQYISNLVKGIEEGLGVETTKK
jgi:hypothetical protein